MNKHELKSLLENIYVLLAEEGPPVFPLIPGSGGLPVPLLIPGLLTPTPEPPFEEETIPWDTRPTKPPVGWEAYEGQWVWNEGEDGAHHWEWLPHPLWHPENQP